MNNTGDGIYIEGGFDNEQINGAIEETLKRVQGLSDGTASAGASMDSTFNDIQQKVTTALNTIDKNIEFNKNEIKNLQAQYKTLGAEMKAALASGNTSLAKDKQAAIQAIDKEIAALANENKELERSKQKVAETAQAWADNQKKQNENAQAHVTLRQRIKEVREEMANLVITAQKNGVQLDETTGRYAELKEELGRLGDIQDDIGQQMRMLANDERQIAGVINGLSGLSGGLSAATGAVSLFAGENENLQKVMTKLQSVMAITMGLQQLQQTLNKDSAFRLTTLASIKQWWGKVEAEANAKAAASTALDTAAKNQNTAAQERNTAAKTANTASTAANTASEVVNAGATSAAGTAASKSAGLFTKLGVAMKSLPKLGWAGLLVGGLIAAVSSVIKKIREVQGAIDEMNTKIAEGATEPVAKIKELQAQWNNLGDDLNKKKKFVDDNKDAFHNLGVEVKDVADAERILNEQTDAFINAQMARAKAMALNEEASKKTKELLKAQADLETTPKQIERTVIHRSTGTYTSYMTDNPAYAKAQQKVKQLESEIHNLYQRVIDENNAAATELENAGIRAAKKSTETTVTNSVKTTTETAEAILKKELAAVKARYEEFYSWVNSGDKDARDAARTEFADLVEQGSTYLEFLKRKRDELTAAIAGGTATNEQAEQMRVLNDQIAQETKETVLSQFEAQLQSEMQGAQSLIEMLEIIKRKRKEVTQQSTGNAEIDDEQQRILNDVERETNEKIAQRTAALLEEYRSFEEKLNRLSTDNKVDKALLEFQRDTEIAKLRKQQSKTTDEEEIQRIESQIQKIQARYGRAIDERENSYNRAAQRIHDEELETLKNSSDVYQSIFGVASNASKKMLQQVLSDAQDILKYVRGEATALPAGISKELAEKIKQSPQEIKELTNLISELQSKLNDESGYPFAPLVQGFKMMRQAREEYASASKNTAEEVAAADRKLQNAEDSAIKQLIEGFRELLELSENVGDKLKSLGEALDDKSLGSIGSFISNISKIGSSVLQGYSSGGWIGALTSGITSTTDAIMSMMIQMAQSVREMEERMQNIAITYRQAVVEASLTLQDIYDSGFGTSQFDKMTDAARLSIEALNKYNDAINQLGSSTSYKVGEEFYGHWYYLWLDSEWHDINKELGDIDGLFDEHGHIIIEKLKALYNAGEFDEDSAMKEKVGLILTYYEQYLDNLEVLQNHIIEIFGYLGDEAINSLTDAIINGGNAWEIWKKKGSKAIEQLGEELVYQLFLAQKFSDFKSLLTKIYGGEGEYAGLSYEQMAEKAMEAMDNFFAQSETAMQGATEWMEHWKALAAQHGFSIWSNEDSNSNSFYGAARTVTETTASLIHGQMNAMRVNQVSQGDILRQQLLMLSSIKSDTAYLRSIDNRLRNIESRTSGTQYAARINH